MEFIEFKHHLEHISRDAKGCPNVPTEVTKQMGEIVQGKKKEKENKKYEESVARMERVDEVLYIHDDVYGYDVVVNSNYILCMCFVVDSFAN